MPYASISEVYGSDFGNHYKGHYKQIMGLDNYNQKVCRKDYGGANSLMEPFSGNVNGNVVGNTVGNTVGAPVNGVEHASDLLYTHNTYNLRNIAHNHQGPYPTDLNPSVRTRVNTRYYPHTPSGTRYKNSVPAGHGYKYHEVYDDDYPSPYDTEDQLGDDDDVSNEEYMKLYSRHYNKCRYYKKVIRKLMSPEVIKDYMSKYDMGDCDLLADGGYVYKKKEVEEKVEKPAEKDKEFNNMSDILLFIAAGIFLIFIMDTFLKLGRLRK